MSSAVATPLKPSSKRRKTVPAEDAALGQEEGIVDGPVPSQTHTEKRITCLNPRDILPSKDRLFVSVAVDSPSFLTTFANMASPACDIVTLWLCNNTESFTAASEEASRSGVPCQVTQFVGISVDSMDTNTTAMIVTRFPLANDAVNIYDPLVLEDGTETAREEIGLTVNVTTLLHALKGIKDYQQMVMFVTRSMSNMLNIMVVSDARDSYVLKVPLLTSQGAHETVKSWNIRFDLCMPLNELKDIVRKSSNLKSERIHFEIRRWSDSDMHKLILVMHTDFTPGQATVFRALQVVFTSVLKHDDRAEVGYALQQLVDAKISLGGSDPGKSPSLQVAESGLGAAEDRLKGLLFQKYDNLDVPRGFVKPARMCTGKNTLGECEREVRDLQLALRRFEDDHNLRLTAQNPASAVMSAHETSTAVEVVGAYCHDVRDAPFLEEDILKLPQEYTAVFSVKKLMDILKTPQCSTVQLHLPSDVTAPVALRFDAGGGDSQAFIAWIMAPLIACD